MKRIAGRLRAIDVYSGVGGWSLGLQLAGIDVVASYDIFGPANETNFKNNHHQAHTVDIHRLELDELPGKIDICVGSPPCTQFSFSNRGGSGDINDGLEDIVKFLQIVDFLKPKYWAMENVPRVAKIIERNLRYRGRLAKFEHLGIVPHVINMADFGLPQRRRRCIAGNFDFSLLSSYKRKVENRTLGDVIAALACDPVHDPLFGIQVPRADVHDHVIEAPLSEEEVRINWANKVVHPVYNAMPFPEPMGRGVRTITATCTRVSRESIVIANPLEPGKYRRLTIRERAALQGFPVTFQFFASRYSEKLRMVGNAVPPYFSYYLGHALRGTPAKDVRPISEVASSFQAPKTRPPVTVPHSVSSRFRPDRTFRFSIPSLRLKSGVRFELANALDARVPWKVAFYFGTSKSIQALKLDRDVYVRLIRRFPKDVYPQAKLPLSNLAEFIRTADVRSMQRLWSHNGFGRTKPFELLDRISDTAEVLTEILKVRALVAQRLVADEIATQRGRAASQLPGLKKLARNAPLILSGLVIGAVVNGELAGHFEQMPAEGTAA